MNKEEVIKGIAMVRRTGLTNMFDRNNVILILEELGYNKIADYLKENRKEYLELLKASSDIE